MKKVICVLLLIAFCLCGCSDNSLDSVFISPNKDIVDFELVSQNNYNNIYHNCIYRDRINDVLYYVFWYKCSNESFFGITPIYGPDGKPIKYAHEAG